MWWYRIFKLYTTATAIKFLPFILLGSNHLPLLMIDHASSHSFLALIVLVIILAAFEQRVYRGAVSKLQRVFYEPGHFRLRYLELIGFLVLTVLYNVIR